MKHILLLFHHYRTPIDRGGLRSWHLGTALAGRGWKVTAIIPGIDPLSGKKHPKLGTKIWVKEEIDGVTVFRVNSFSNNRDSKIARVAYYISSSILQAICSLFGQKVNIVFCTSMPISLVFISYLISKIKHSPLLIDVRDLTFDTAFELGYLKKGHLFGAVHVFETWLFKRASCLFAVSKGMKRLLEDKGIHQDKVDFLPIGYSKIDQPQKNLKVSNLIRKYQLNDKFVVLYAGTMGYVVDVDTVLDAAALTNENKQIIYLFVGDGQRINDYKKRAEKEGCNCLFIRSVPKQEIQWFCLLAGVCVFPLIEGKITRVLFGNKIFDYLGNGKPVIYSGPNGDVSELLEESGGGLVVSPNGNELKNAILKMYSNPILALNMGKKGKSYIEKHYQVETIMEKAERLISAQLPPKS